jgi:hypothetical protein
MERGRFTMHDIGQGWRLAMVVSTRSVVGGHRILRKVGGRGERACIWERELRKVKGQLLWGDLDEFASSVGHPPIETFSSIPDSEFAMIQIVVELIPEFLQNLDPCLSLVTFDLHPLEFVLAVY